MTAQGFYRFNVFLIGFLLLSCTSIKSRMYMDKSKIGVCNCVVGVDSLNITFDSIIVYSFAGYGAYTLGAGSANRIKAEGKKILIADSTRLNQSRALLFSDCQFRKYIDSDYPIDIFYDYGFTNVMEVHLKSRQQSRVVQMMVSKSFYIYSGDSSAGKCNNVMDTFFLKLVK